MRAAIHQHRSDLEPLDRANTAASSRGTNAAAADRSSVRTVFEADLSPSRTRATRRITQLDGESTASGNGALPQPTYSYDPEVVMLPPVGDEALSGVNLSGTASDLQHYPLI